MVRTHFVAALRNWFHREKIEQDLDEELRAHVQMLADEKFAAGMDADQAWQAALREVGAVFRVKEQVREARAGHLGEQIWQDVRFGTRILRNTPGLSLAAIAAMALGIGATTVMFAVVNAVLLQPLAYPQAHRLIYMTEAYQRRPGMSFSFLDLTDVQAQNQVFSSVAGISPHSFLMTGGDKPELLNSRYVSHDFFTTLRIKPLLGRDFTADDDRGNSAPVALISYGLWQRRFGGDANVVGRGITLDQREFTIVGVIPRVFTYRDEQPDVFTPLGLLIPEDHFATVRSDHSGIYAVGRLKDGVTLEQARADLDRIAVELQQKYQETNRDNWFSAVPLRDRIVRSVKGALLTLLLAVLCLLLIACANVANLLLARATVRSHELAVRSALGASRARLLRQLFTESVLLSCCGGFIGVLLAWWGTRLLVTSARDALPRVHEIGVNLEVLGFAILISVLTGLVFGTAPALQASKTNIETALKESSPTGTPRDRLRRSLVVGELALSLVLVVTAGLLIRSFIRVTHVDLGFNPHDVFTAELKILERRYPKPEQAEAFFDEALRNIAAIPGVAVAAAAIPLPLSGNEWDTNVRTDQTDVANKSGVSTQIQYISPGYLRALQVPLIEGREFNDRDNDFSLPVVMVNESFAKRAWPGKSPLGERVRMGSDQDIFGGDLKAVPWRTVVGVMGDEKQSGPVEDMPPQIYMPYTQHYGKKPNVITRRDLIVRSVGVPPEMLANALRNAVLRVDKDEALAEVHPMDWWLDQWLASRKMTMYLLVGFASFAVLLAVIGIYGVVSFWVLQRNREIGIRMALGASRAKVLRLVLTQGAKLASFGLALGATGALISSKLTAGLLYGVPPRDATTLLAVTSAMLIVVITASLIPARRATKVDPSVALRYE